MINNSSPISFKGLKIEGVVSTQNIKKLGAFADAAENYGFIKDIEKIFNTNMVLNGTLDEISFSHNEYGDLTRYNCRKFPAKDFFSNVVIAMDSIKTAIKKAEKDFKAQKENHDKFHRGC